jgi:non-specific serine/threonine protein kinase
LLDEYPDGVWLVELASLADQTLLVQAVARTLGLREVAGQPLLRTLLAYLKDRQLLLVLDNCEHLVAACAELVMALLQACPRVHVLATSRAGLGVAGERLYRVPSLAIPSLDHLPPPEELSVFPAVGLFVARAQERRADFALTTQNARAVAQVCARLDGMPLAIELAAARVGSLPVEAIAARLDDRFRLLTGGPRTALPRQQTLRAALDWSYDLLTEGEQRLLHRLSVFAGGCSLAAEAVCAGPGVADWEVLNLLSGLVNKSLVLLEERAGEGRYLLLETVRQYGRERLEAAGEQDGLASAHAAWCLALAELAEPALTGSEQEVWLTRLEQEHDNLRAALRWADEHGAGELQIQLAGALWRFWYGREHFSEGLCWLERTLAQGNAAGASAPFRGRALRGAGVLAWERGDRARSRTLCEESLALYRELGDRRAIATALISLGNVAEDYAQARAVYEESLALCRELGDRQGMATSLTNLGNWTIVVGDRAEARALIEHGLALYRELGDRRGIAMSLNNLGHLAARQGDYAGAQARYEESLALLRKLGDRPKIVLLLTNLGEVAEHQGDHPRARALCEDGLALARELDDGATLITADALRGLGLVAARQGDYALARVLLEESLALLRKLANLFSGSTLFGLALIAERLGEYAQARVLYEESLTLGRDLGDKLGAAESLEGLARLAGAQGQPQRGAQLWGVASALRQALGTPRPPREQGEYEAALVALRTALGEDAFAVAWAPGRALPLEAAIAYALEKDPAPAQ